MKSSLSILTLGILVMYMAAVFVFACPLKDYAFSLLGLIPAYFWTLDAVNVFVLDKIKGNGVTVLMGFEVARIMISLVVLLVYVFTIKEQAVAFVLTFCTFYILNLILVTFVLIRQKKKEIKKTQEDE